MDREAQTISTDEEIWNMLPADARAEWHIHQSINRNVINAAQDTCVQSVARLLISGNPLNNEATKNSLKTTLEGYLARSYGVPPDFDDEVFAKAGELILEEMGTDGQA